MTTTIEVGQTWRAKSGNEFTVKRIDGEWVFVWWFTDARTIRLHESQILTTDCVLVERKDEQAAVHTPGPWKTGTVECRSLDAVFGPLDGQHGVTSGVIAQCGAVARPAAENEANARLIAAAPDLFAELRETADWLTERAGVLRGIAVNMPQGELRSQSGQRRQRVLDEAARIEGRAAVIRQTILKAGQ